MEIIPRFVDDSGVRSFAAVWASVADVGAESPVRRASVPAPDTSSSSTRRQDIRTPSPNHWCHRTATVAFIGDVGTTTQSRRFFCCLQFLDFLRLVPFISEYFAYIFLPLSFFTLLLLLCNNSNESNVLKPKRIAIFYVPTLRPTINFNY